MDVHESNILRLMSSFKHLNVKMNVKFMGAALQL